MRRLRQILALAVLAGLFGLAPALVSAQDQQGVAVITSPLPGALVTGVVPIGGTATHSQFSRYELAFAYSPNPTDTWFVIESADTPVAGDVLARWDTTNISDGVYSLRLRVFGAPDSFVERMVPDVRVANVQPTAPPSLPLATVTPAPTANEPQIALPPTETPRPTALAPLEAPTATPAAPADPGRFGANLVGEAFLAGVRLTLILFSVMAAYWVLRALLRAAWRRR